MSLPSPNEFLIHRSPTVLLVKGYGHKRVDGPLLPPGPQGAQYSLKTGGGARHNRLFNSTTNTVTLLTLHTSDAFASDLMGPKKSWEQWTQQHTCSTFCTFQFLGMGPQRYWVTPLQPERCSNTSMRVIHRTNLPIVWLGKIGSFLQPPVLTVSQK